MSSDPAAVIREALDGFRYDDQGWHQGQSTRVDEALAALDVLVARLERAEAALATLRFSSASTSRSKHARR